MRLVVGWKIILHDYLRQVAADVLWGERPGFVKGLDEDLESHAESRYKGLWSRRTVNIKNTQSNVMDFGEIYVNL